VRRPVKFALVAAAIFGAVSVVTLFVGGAVAAEGALHPARLAVALVCPCLSHMHCASVAIRAHDGVSLRAWYYTPDQPNNKAIILFHGVGSNRQDMVALGNLFLKHGYSVLEPDLRGHGESGGIATYGVLEAGDTSAWVDWLEKTGRWSGIYGFGASLGASVLLESLQHETRFRAVIAESPYFDFSSAADERIARMLPTGTKWVARPFVESGMIWARLRDGVDLRNASAADGVRVTATPILLIHGLADEKTSPENSRRLTELRPGVQLWLVPGSHHADAWATARGAFESRVLAWFGEQ
jgi:dipeptidyl aminopeptidase/acylaminoacyl peptidase